MRSFAFCLFSVLTLPFAAQAQIVSSGTVTIPGTDEFSFDSGTLTATNPDVFWEQFGSGSATLNIGGAATIVNLGAVNFSSITAAQLQAATYGTTGISNTILASGDVFAVRTNAGNYAKVLVTGSEVVSSDYGLPIQWVTYSPVSNTPAPSTILLVLTGMAAVTVLQFRRQVAGFLLGNR